MPRWMELDDKKSDLENRYPVVQVSGLQPVM